MHGATRQGAARHGSGSCHLASAGPAAQQCHRRTCCRKGAAHTPPGQRRCAGRLVMLSRCEARRRGLRLRGGLPVRPVRRHLERPPPRAEPAARRRSLRTRGFSTAASAPAPTGDAGATPAGKPSPTRTAAGPAGRRARADPALRVAPQFPIIGRASCRPTGYCVVVSHAAITSFPLPPQQVSSFPPSGNGSGPGAGNGLSPLITSLPLWPRMVSLP